MVFPANNLAQQTYGSALQQRGEVQQQQINQRQIDDRASVKNRNPQGEQTQRAGTQAAQSARSNTNFADELISGDLTESKAQKLAQQNLPRGSLVDISA